MKRWRFWGKVKRHCEEHVIALLRHCASRHCEEHVIARNEAIFTHVMLSEVEASTSGTLTDPSTTLRMTKAVQDDKGSQDDTVQRLLRRASSQ